MKKEKWYEKEETRWQQIEELVYNTGSPDHKIAWKIIKGDYIKAKYGDKNLSNDEEYKRIIRTLDGWLNK